MRKLIVLVVILPLAVLGFLFGGLNSAEVTFHWLLGSTRMPLVVLLAGTLTLGIVLGAVLDRLVSRLWRRRVAPAKSADPVMP
jgi:uncharacterized membrane protein YciS (DUF1049 family)